MTPASVVEALVFAGVTLVTLTLWVFPWLSAASTLKNVCALAVGGALLCGWSLLIRHHLKGLR